MVQFRSDNEVLTFHPDAAPRALAGLEPREAKGGAAAPRTSALRRTTTAEPADSAAAVEPLRQSIQRLAIAPHAVPSDMMVEARLAEVFTARTQRDLRRMDDLDERIERLLGKETADWIGQEQKRGNFQARRSAEGLLPLRHMLPGGTVNLAGRGLRTVPPYAVQLVARQVSLDLRANHLRTLPPALFAMRGLHRVQYQNGKLFLLGAPDWGHPAGAVLSFLRVGDNPVLEGVLAGLPRSCSNTSATEVFAYVEHFGASALPYVNERPELIHLGEVRAALAEADEADEAKPAT